MLMRGRLCFPCATPNSVTFCTKVCKENLQPLNSVTFCTAVCLKNKNKNKPTMGQKIANGTNSAPRDFDCVVVIFVVVIVVTIAIVIVMIFVILVMIKRLNHHHHHHHQISTVTISGSVSAPP